MTGDRATPINKQSIYIDFRYLISAFDRYFYTEQEPKTDHSYIRRAASRLSNFLNGKAYK
jgi:hypothetical protein